MEHRSDPMLQGRLSIAVLLGGPSAERGVSCRSGEAVAVALESRGHRVRRIDPNPKLGNEGSRGSSDQLAEAAWMLAGVDWGTVDVVFNALHGVFGEDGQAQAILDSLGIPYTGSEAAASRDGFRKSLAKRRFRAAGVPTPRDIECRSDWSLEQLVLAGNSIGYPLIVKPDAQGSSLGVSIVQSPAELPTAIERCASFGAGVLFEEFIAGTEWTVPVWDAETLPVIQIVAAEEFYDFAAKYSDDRTEYRLDFDVPNAIVRLVATVGLQAARALGMQGLSRADIRLTADGRPFVLEVNSSPGMTDHSLVPKSAVRAGLSLGELCEQECRRAIGRHETRALRRRA